MQRSIWSFIPNASPPPQKKQKTAEDKRAQQREYDSSHRERTYQPSWEKEMGWLSYNKDKKEMTCTICSKFEKTGPFVNGCNNFRVATLKKHQESDAHIKNSHLSDNASGSIDITQTEGAKALHMINKAAYDKLTYLFRNAHYVAKSGRPYTDYRTLCLLDKAKGLDIGNTYQTDKYCQVFINQIAEHHRQTQDGIIHDSPFLSIISMISDGSTDTASKEAEIVVLRTSVECRVQTHFMGIRNVPRADADTITQAIAKLLTGRFGDAWHSKIVAMGTDGASVMLGKRSGVVQKMRELTKRDFIVGVHCSAHRLELAYKDAYKKLVSAIPKKCDVLLLNLYLFYKYSPLNRSNLDASFKALGLKSRVPTRVGGTRWLPHTQRSLQNVLYGYDAIVQHLEQIQNPSDKSSKKDSAAKGKNFLHLLKDKKMVFWFHLLMDVVSCLSTVSQSIQASGATLADVWVQLETARKMLVKYKTSDGPYVRKFTEKNEDETTIMNVTREKFLDAIVAGINARFQGDLNLFKGSSFTSFQNWPEDGDIDSYADDEVAQLAAVCRPALCSSLNDSDDPSAAIEQEWTSFKLELSNSKKNIRSLTWASLSGMSTKYPSLFLMINYLLTLPSSSVDAERGFSLMKLVKSDWRSRLGDGHLSDLMLIQSEVAEVGEFRPDGPIDLWNANQHSDRSRRPFYMDHHDKKSVSYVCVDQQRHELPAPADADVFDLAEQLVEEEEAEKDCDIESDHSCKATKCQDMAYDLLDQFID